MASSVSVAESATILDLPSEVLQNIAMNLPFPYDALSLSQASRQLYTMLSPENKYFWYERRRTYETSRNETHSGVIKKDASEPFDEKHDYRQLVVDARRGEKGGNKLQRCQICCFQRAHKKWEEWKMWICPGCFELVAIDRPLFKFMKLDVSGLKCQKKRRNMSIRYCYWRADVDRLVQGKFGRSLDEMVAENEAAKTAKENAVKTYRDRHAGLLAKVIEDLIENDPECSNYFRFLDLELVKSKIKGTCQDQAHLFNFRKSDHSQKWLVDFARKRMLPGPQNEFPRSCGRILDNWTFRGAVRTSHFERFGYVVNPDPVNVRSMEYHKRFIDPAAGEGHKEPCGVCPYCFAEPRKEKGEYYTKVFNYMTVEQLIDHVVGCHYTKALSEEFWFLEGVKGREVVRLEKYEARPAVEVPDGANTRVIDVGSAPSSGGRVVVERQRVGQGFLDVDAKVEDDLDSASDGGPVVKVEDASGHAGVDEELESDNEDEDLAAEVEDLVRDNLKAEESVSL